MERHFTTPDFDTVRYSYTTDLSPICSPIPRHCHDFYELSYIVRGTGKYIVEGMQYPIRPGALMILCPQTFHYVELEAGQPYERYIIHFYPDALTEEARYLLSCFKERQAAGEGNFYAESDLPPDFSEMVSRFEPRLPLPERELNLLISLRLSEILLILTQTKSFPGERMDNRLGARVVLYLNENIREKIGLDELARIFFVSKYYLCRTFKEHTGESIHGYLNRKRVMLAKQLIDGGETAANAAYRAGFGDYSSFFRAYKKLIGHAPSEK